MVMVTTQEGECQRRQRVVSRIKEGLGVVVAEDLVRMARLGKLPERWMPVAEINRLLDDGGYWTSHVDPLASFLKRSACEEIVAKALGELACLCADTWAQSGEQFKPYHRDWAEYARETANRLRREMPDESRTALHSGTDGASVVFGNDDYAGDARARQEVALLRRCLQEAGIPELGFNVSDDGRGWAVVVLSQDADTLGQVLFGAWQSSFEIPDEL